MWGAKLDPDSLRKSLRVNDAYLRRNPFSHSRLPVIALGQLRPTQQLTPGLQLLRPLRRPCPAWGVASARAWTVLLAAADANRDPFRWQKGCPPLASAMGVPHPPAAGLAQARSKPGPGQEVGNH